MIKAFSLLILTLIMSHSASAKSSSVAEAKKKLPQLRSISSNKLILEAVKLENTKQKSLVEIKEIDKKWVNSYGPTPIFIKKFTENKCAQYLISIGQKNPFIAEVFVMDTQGAIVCQSQKTSDYWQGDEAIWQKSFNGGSGKEFINKPSFDESTQAYLVQISLPIKEANKTIGVITFGLDLDNLE